MTARSVLLDLPGRVLDQMTPRLIAIYVCIVDFVGECGYPPSVRDICAHTEIPSTSAVHAALRRLEELGLIARTPDRARAITVVEWDRGVAA